jgi:hypothetical protein
MSNGSEDSEGPRANPLPGPGRRRAALDRTGNRRRDRGAEFPLVTAPAADETDEDALESCHCRHDLTFRKNYGDVVPSMCFVLLRYGPPVTCAWSYPQARAPVRAS